MPGFNEMRDEALSKYDDDLNEIEPEGAPPGGEEMSMEEAPMEEGPAEGPEGMVGTMLSEVGIQASPEQISEFMDLLQGAAEEAMGGAPGGEEMGGEMAEEPMV